MDRKELEKVIQLLEAGRELAGDRRTDSAIQFIIEGWECDNQGNKIRQF